MSRFYFSIFLHQKLKDMDNKELAKELLGYTYIDIQKIPEIYELLDVDIEKVKEDCENDDYESALYTLMDTRAAHIVFRFLMNPRNRLKKKLS